MVSGSTTSERMRRLIQAANVTGLDLSVPEQPVRTDEDVRKFRSGELVGQGRSEEGKPMGKGSILAWMGHLDVLEWYVLFVPLHYSVASRIFTILDVLFLFSHE